jgi:hypothetical protein
MKNSHPSTTEPPRKKARRTEACSQCAACIRLFSQSSLSKLNSRGFPHLTRNDCTASVNRGCKLCKIIFSLVVKEFGNRWASHERITFRNLSPLKNSIHLLRGTLKDEEGYINLYPFALSGTVLILLFQIEHVLT